VEGSVDALAAVVVVAIDARIQEEGGTKRECQAQTRSELRTAYDDEDDDDDEGVETSSGKV